MKRNTALVMVLGCVLVAGFAIAAPPDRASATFDQFAASGISGEVDLMSTQRGGTMIRGRLSGLQEDTEYVVLLSDDESCAESVSSEDTEVVTLRVNKAGVAHFNQRVSVNLEDIGTLAVRLRGGDQTLLACAVVSTD